MLELELYYTLFLCQKGNDTHVFLLQVEFRREICELDHQSQQDLVNDTEIRI